MKTKILLLWLLSSALAFASIIGLTGSFSTPKATAGYAVVSASIARVDGSVSIQVTLYPSAPTVPPAKPVQPLQNISVIVPAATAAAFTGPPIQAAYTYLLKTTTFSGATPVTQ